jgi:hypothetical protein
MAQSEEISIVEEIEQLASRRHFEPFAIITASGSRYEIGARDAVMVGRSVLVIYPYAGGQQLLRERQISEVCIAGGSP